MNLKAKQDIRRKLSVMRDAKETGNACKVCRYCGISCESCYQWKCAYKAPGEAGGALTSVPYTGQKKFAKIVWCLRFCPANKDCLVTEGSEIQKGVWLWGFIALLPKAFNKIQSYHIDIKYQ